MQAEGLLELMMDNNFVLDCPQMLLSPMLPTSSKRAHKGPGFVSQNPDGRLIFKIYCTDGISPHEDIEGFFSINTGEIISAQHYYNLSVTDWKGIKWEAKRILPETNSGPAGSFIHGHIEELYYSDQLHKSLEGYYADIYFPGDIDIPCNRTSKVEKLIDGKQRALSGHWNIAKFDACGFEFELEKEKERLVFCVQSKTEEINNASILRFTEALQFVLGRSLSWSVLVLTHAKNTKVIVRPLNKNDKKARFGPPIALQHCMGVPNLVWVLFQKYLEYVIGYQKASWHPLFCWIHTIIESGSASLDVTALILSVAIEGVLKLPFSELKPLNSNFEVQVNKTIEIILQSDLENNFKNRLVRTLDSMSNTRPKDQLHILNNKGLINKALIKQYEELRNRLAHGTLVPGVQLQLYVDRCAAVLVLFYHLIFAAIGYTGEYTDYSNYEFPLRVFPDTLPVNHN